MWQCQALVVPVVVWEHWAQCTQVLHGGFTLFQVITTCSTYRKQCFLDPLATAGLCTVGDLRENNRWKEIAQLQQRYQVGPYFLKGFVRKLYTAMPAVWFTLPDTEATPSLLSISFPPKTPIPLSSKRMYVQMTKCRDVRPLAEDKWTLPSWSEGWSTACSAILDSRLDTPYSNDIAFKFLHCVLPTPDRLTIFRPSHDTSCNSCGN